MFCLSIYCIASLHKFAVTVGHKCETSFLLIRNKKLLYNLLIFILCVQFVLAPKFTQLYPEQRSALTWCCILARVKSRINANTFANSQKH